MKNCLKKNRAQRGFTLIEVLVVVVIISILAAVIVPRVMNTPQEARIAKARQDVQALVTALRLYQLHNSQMPSTDQGLDALVQKPSGNPPANAWQEGGYIDALPADPWGNPYQYLNPGRNGGFEVFSLGADGAPGGEGADQDISNRAP